MSTNKISGAAALIFPIVVPKIPSSIRLRDCSIPLAYAGPHPGLINAAFGRKSTDILHFAYSRSAKHQKMLPLTILAHYRCFSSGQRLKDELNHFRARPGESVMSMEWIDLDRISRDHKAELAQELTNLLPGRAQNGVSDSVDDLIFNYPSALLAFMAKHGQVRGIVYTARPAICQESPVRIATVREDASAVVEAEVIYAPKIRIEI